MATETVRIIAVGNDSVWVETQNFSACASCAGRDGCGQTWARMLAPKGGFSVIRVTVPPDTNVQWQVGDLVELFVKDSALVSAAFLAYGLPLILLVLGAFIGDKWSGNDAGAISGAFVGIVSGLLSLRFIHKIPLLRNNFHPELVGRAQSNNLRS